MTLEELRIEYETSDMSVEALRNIINFSDNISYEMYRQLPRQGSEEKVELLVKQWKKLETYEIY